MIKLFNKKAEKLLTIWWFGVLAIIGAGIVLGTMLFFSAHIDIRQLEAEMISEKVADCLNNGIEINEDFLTLCGFEKSLFEENSDYFIMISIGDETHKFGRSSFETECGIKKGLIKSKYYPECIEKTIEISGKKIDILTGSNYRGEVIANG